MCARYARITIRRSWVKGRGLFLGDLLDFAVQLAGGRLVELDAVGQAARLDGVQEAQRAHAVHVGRVLGQVERDLGEARKGREKKGDEMSENKSHPALKPNRSTSQNACVHVVRPKVRQGCLPGLGVSAR